MAHRPLRRTVITCVAVTLGALTSAPAAHAATEHEAEDATISQGLVESNHAGFTGRGFVNDGWPDCEGTSGSCGGFVAPKKTWPTNQASPSGLSIINDHVFVATTVGQRVYRMRIDAGANLVEQSQYFQGTYNRLRTVEVDAQGDIWPATSTDRDGQAGNDRILHVDIVYSAG